ncbi:hypothetical protein [Streptomyces hesseae]|uniref:Glutathionylspermidine synthase pre-ATP-grasp-like domain-containing protein n=1 Tax=Streptomyces hesseae TaxID=3075519 RepID=A0ABU2SJM1_9ACTN|nr:hypothetical protein [Streptomyces sp. DSM 40473]MDT0449169.1 hypothetical protein [Streptomyces sp. DSM 40473]
MDEVTTRYVELCRADSSGLSAAVAEAELPAALRDARLLARPLFADEPGLRSAADDLLALFDVLVTLPDRLFDGDIERYWAALGGEPRLAPLLRRHVRAGRPADRFGRADLYRDEHGFALLEFNIAGGVGGFELGELPRSLEAVPAFAAFAERYALRHVRTAERVAATLRAVAPRPSPVVALVFAPGALARYRRPVAPTVAVLEGQGLEVVLGELGDVRGDAGKLFVGTARVDVALRFFTVDDTIGHEDALDAITRAHEKGTAVLWTGLDSALFTNKGALALLSDPRCDAVLSERERRVTERILPWTRLLTAPLVDRCVEERDQMILKPCRGFAGSGVVAGWACPEREWRDTLRSAADGGFVVQRRVVPRPEPVVDPGTGATEDWTPVWGLFVTPDGYGGNAIRAQRATGGDVIGYSTSSETLATVAFTRPAGDRPTGDQPPDSARAVVSP